MPATRAASGFGWYSDWWNGGAGGQPAWETFHLTELRQLLERDWQAGDERVIAGLSMGGYGAMHYATATPSCSRPRLVQRRRRPGRHRQRSGYRPPMAGAASRAGRRLGGPRPGGDGGRARGQARLPLLGDGEPGPLDSERRGLRRPRSVGGPAERGPRCQARGAGHPRDRRVRPGHPHVAVLGAGPPPTRCRCCSRRSSGEPPTKVLSHGWAQDVVRGAGAAAVGGSPDRRRARYAASRLPSS